MLGPPFHILSLIMVSIRLGESEMIDPFTAISLFICFEWVPVDRLEPLYSQALRVLDCQEATLQPVKLG